MKIFELLSRRADQSRDVALTYWTDRHAALVKARLGGNPITQRYINNVGLSRQPSPNVPPFDGAVGAWLTLDPETFAKHISTPGNPVVEDEPNFLACRPVPMLVDERVLRAPAQLGATAKLILFLRRAPDLDREPFEAALLDAYAASAIATWGAALVGLTINLGRPMLWGHWGPEWPLYDAAVELWLNADDATIMHQLSSGDPVLARIAPSTATLQVREVVQIDQLPEGA